MVKRLVHTQEDLSSTLSAATSNKNKGAPNIKIYSRKKDYYDSIQAYGQDSAVIYKRKTLVRRVDDDEYNLVMENPSARELIDGLKYVSKNIDGLSLEAQLIIFFCGVPYPCFIYDYKYTKKFCCYSIDDVKALIEKYGTRDQKARWNNKKSKWVWLSSKQEIWMPKIFELSKHLGGNKHLYELHHKLGVPIFAYVKNLMTNVIILNPILKKYKFYKAIDTYTAFQKINMFISGILGGISPPMIEVSNDTKIAKHGYDKWSFRREPWKK